MFHGNLVTVIIPTYNRAWSVGRAVSSVLDQTFTDYELIVVDDGSTDRTREILDQYRERLVIITQPRAGVSAARNKGLMAASGSLIAFLDSDDYWLPEKLAAQVDLFVRKIDTMICQTEEIWLRRGRRVNPRNRHRKPAGEAFGASLKLCVISPSAVMIRREIFDVVGTFDETLPACEDYDLWLRITCRYPVALIDQPLIVKTGGHGDQLSATTIGLDQYRVKALQKILISGCLTPEQAAAARSELILKARIYGEGCLKRGRADEGRYYLEIADTWHDKAAS